MATAPASSARDAPGIRYEYMFEKDKMPTRQLDALLRAMALYIKNNIGDVNDSQLTPHKMAAFYKAVGGDYDSIFINGPRESISMVWKVTGCQHCLLPTDDDYATPSIPALTLRGFSRWQSLEILLGPEEHVPYMQYAVQNWELKDPETGEPFPPDLPSEVFPTHTDPDVDYWHQSRAELLRGNSKREEDPLSPADDPPSPTSKGGRHGFAYVRPREKRMEHLARHVAYVQPQPRAAAMRGHGRSPDRTARDSPSRPEGRRRKSLSEHHQRGPPTPEVIPDQYAAYPPPYVNPSAVQATPRRHSLQPEVTSDSSEEEVIDLQQRRLRHASPNAPPSSRRAIPPLAPQPPSAVGAPPPIRSHRSDMTAEIRKRRSGGSPTGSLRKVTDGATNLFPVVSGKPQDRERPRIEVRQSSYRHPEATLSRSREQPLPIRRSKSYSDLTDSDDATDPDTSEDELRHRQMLRNEGGFRDGVARRGSDRSEREDDKELDRRSRVGPPVRRQPNPGRERGSSHAELDRRKIRQDWDRERERDRMSYDRDARPRKWDREKDRRAAEDQGGNLVTAVPMRGARYADPGYAQM